MAFCTKCGAQVPDGSTFCTACGATLAAAAPAPAPVPQQAAPAPAPQPQAQQQNNFQQNMQQQYQQFQQAQAAPASSYDHTAEFDPKDISENKVYAMATYLLGVIGIVIALLASRDSKYAAFHVRQAMKLEMTSILLLVCCIVPILGWLVAIVGAAIIEVLTIIAFFQVCSGKAKEPAIIRSFPFMK